MPYQRLLTTVWLPALSSVSTARRMSPRPPPTSFLPPDDRSYPNKDRNRILLRCASTRTTPAVLPATNHIMHESWLPARTRVCMWLMCVATKSSHASERERAFLPCPSARPPVINIYWTCAWWKGKDRMPCCTCTVLYSLSHSAASRPVFHYVLYSTLFVITGGIKTDR